MSDGSRLKNLRKESDKIIVARVMDCNCSMWNNKDDNRPFLQVTTLRELPRATFAPRTRTMSMQGTTFMPRCIQSTRNVI